ncbi:MULTISPECIES: helix-turn-helix domain-containing protein [Xanthomonas]|uniref:helix-turn-helix domain-containing protein n=2 Tax=Xanthomonas TaxID=338 RepID=UPI00278C7721|nr:helix-turn-helix transcriptional regulator [Xanthomonas hortorum]MEB1935791.1 helix-turn-helix transcriptional regulator [Xanthomonas campestris pv. campestris]MEB1977422.1 helix-turn-helix transcriptional regulator [Xanthomonas campestris pv. campestris]MEB2026859.1 helix-turn-helix transcriptional regulator [Xanthomonas campestris pv. campestris]
MTDVKSGVRAVWPRLGGAMFNPSGLHRMHGRPRATDSTQYAKPVPAERLIFARNFRKARKAAKLSQIAVKNKTGFAQAWISAVETGKSAPTIDSMAVLAKCVGVPLWQLLVP